MSQYNIYVLLEHSSVFYNILFSPSMIVLNIRFPFQMTARSCHPSLQHPGLHPGPQPRPLNPIHVETNATAVDDIEDDFNWDRLL